MNLHNYKRASDIEVRKWLTHSIKDMTPYQKEKLIEDCVIEDSPFEFVKKRKFVPNFWLRLTAIAVPFVWVALVSGLPLNFFITGSWGYSNKRLEWFNKWRNNIGL